jgi:hypothetical protein
MQATMGWTALGHDFPSLSNGHETRFKVFQLTRKPVSCVEYSTYLQCGVLYSASLDVVSTDGNR